MHQIKTLFWDVDGVFVDTEVLHFRAWQMLVEKFNKTLTLEEYLPMVGRGGMGNVKAVCALKSIPGNYDELNKIRRNFYAGLREKGVPLIESNIRLVRECAEIFPHMNQVVVSSSSRKDISENLLAAGLQDCFKTMISFEDVAGFKRKPAPDIYLFALKATKSDKNEVLVFEDSLNGLLSAKGAGLKCIALPNNLTVRQPLNTAADMVISSDQGKDIAEILKLADLL